GCSRARARRGTCASRPRTKRRGRPSWSSFASAGAGRPEGAMPAFVEIDFLGKTYDTPTGPAVIVRDFTLHVAEGEFLCIVGHSGCGKSTVLSILMGLNQPTTGGVTIAGREVDGPGTDRGVVF